MARRGKCERQSPQSMARGVANGVVQGRRDGHDGGFTNTGQRQILTVDQDHVDLRQVAEAVLRSSRVEDLAESAA